jgi:hypothetical protein
MSDQPALTTSSGRVWMIVGTVLAVVCIGVLVALTWVQLVLALIGAIIVALLYVAMWVVRSAVQQQRTRLIVLASLFGAITAVTLLCVIFISASARLGV